MTVYMHKNFYSTCKNIFFFFSFLISKGKSTDMFSSRMPQILADTHKKSYWVSTNMLILELRTLFHSTLYMTHL